MILNPKQILFYSKLYGVIPNIINVKSHSKKYCQPIITSKEQFYQIYPTFDWKYYQENKNYA